MPLTFHLGRILQLFCSITWISVFMLRKRWNLPLNLPYLRTPVPIFWVPLMIPPTIWGPTDPFPFSGPQPLGPSSKTLSWDPLGMSCKKVRRYCALFDSYLTYSTVIAKTPWAYLANISHFFIGLKLFWLTKNQFKSIKRGVKFSKDFWLNFGRYRRLLQIHSLIS